LKNIDRKYISAIKTLVSVTLAGLLVLSFGSCSIVRTVTKRTNEEVFVLPEEDVSEEATKNSGSVDFPDREEITIPKSDSIASNNGVTSAGQAYNSVSEVYVAVADTVVEITTETVQTSIWMGQYVSTGAGSGVIIDESGLIVTNHHVIEGANNVTVRLTDGSEYDASIVGTDEAADLAVIKISVGDKKLTAAKLGCSADLVVGEDVVALGNPLGSLGGTLTTGIISATERNIIVNGEAMVLLQTNAAINPGNSGGGLFNMAGQLIGVVNAKVSGDDVEGLGFAIPVDFAHTVIEDLINYGYVRGVVDHGLVLLDVTVQNLPSAYRKYGITNVGVVILESRLTDKLKYGDTVVSVNGHEIDSSKDIELIIKGCSIGDVIKITVMRERSVVEAELTLGEKGPETVDFD
jgi:serine protease Do